MLSSLPFTVSVKSQPLPCCVILEYIRFIDQLIQKGSFSMCVGLPAKVVRIKDGMALVDASGARREVSAELLADIDPGDYVMVHAGLAIAKITADDEEESSALLQDFAAAEETAHE